MDTLQIDDRGVEDERLEFPINNWLAENDRLNVRAGAIWHPTHGTSGKEDGILLMSQFIDCDRKDDSLIQDVEEDEKWDIPVKEWLVGEGGVRPEDLEWLGVWDTTWLTRTGTRPKRNDVRGTFQGRIPSPVKEYTRMKKCGG